jgi:homospermidine synthase
MSKKIILIGLGGVGTTFLEMLAITRIGINILEKYKKILIFDSVDKTKEYTFLKIKKYIPTFFQKLEINQDNIDILLRSIYKKDMVVDLSYNICFKPIISHCLNVGANYINTSLERWPVENEENLNVNFDNKLLYKLHQEAKLIGKNIKNNSAIILTHGMNPGLISHFTKIGLIDICKKILEISREKKINNYKIESLKTFLEEKNFSQIAKLLELKTIHCSEKDTQKSNIKKNDEFLNTWSPYGFYSECVDPIQIGWGTDETIKLKKNIQDGNFCIKERGCDYTTISYIPECKINGMLIPHSENDTLSKYLEVYEEEKLVYKPSVYFVYSPCEDAIKSLEMVKLNNYKYPEKEHLLILKDLESGSDTVGALLIFSCDPIENIIYQNKITKISNYWCGSILSVENCKNLGFVNSGPTTVQVGISILSAIKYIHENNPKGVLFPEDLPETIVEDCKLYLGTFFSDFLKTDIRQTDFLMTNNNLKYTNNCVLI